MAWEQGRAIVESLITTGVLERVPPNLSAAQSLVEVAETHLASALTLAETDTVLAYDALHAQLEPPLGRDLSDYHCVRRARNAGDYREEHDAVAADVLADHPGCQKIVDIAKRVIGQMPPF
jgi:hypothetical protein